MNLKLVFEQGDPVLIAVFLILLLMSVLTWTIIIVRSLKLFATNKANAKAKRIFWKANNLDEAITGLENSTAPLGKISVASYKARCKYDQAENKTLGTSVPINEYLTYQIRNSITLAMRGFDNGLTALASVGATAPFVGLFGTVWGIYHALINISESGQMSIAEVAGPIGEALVATAFGLFVAIPAVLAYNAIVRRNKVLMQDVDHFAYDLHMLLLNSNNKDLNKDDSEK